MMDSPKEFCASGQSKLIWGDMYCMEADISITSLEEAKNEHDECKFRSWEDPKHLD